MSSSQLVLQQLYLHGLHHKLSWSSPNKARHFFGVFASVSQRGRHKHTHRDKKKEKKKKEKKENGHVISQTKTCSQGLDLGWQHWDVLHIDQAIRLQILQASTCQFTSDCTCTSCNETPVTPSYHQHIRTDIIHTNTLLWTPFFPKHLGKNIK